METQKIGSISNQIGYVLFDLDGTIIDSEAGVTKSAQAALLALGILESQTNLRSFIGPPLRESFKRYTQNEELVEKAISVYRERYTNAGLYECQLYPGIANFLRDLYSTGKKVILASAKPEPYCKKILKYLNVIQYFDNVFGATFDGKYDDKSVLLADIIKQIGNPPKNQIVMVGDRCYDILAAHANGIRAIGVNYGFAKVNELEASYSDYIARDVDDLRWFLI
jgi:Predicted phosphatases